MYLRTNSMILRAPLVDSACARCPMVSITVATCTWYIYKGMSGGGDGDELP